MLDPFHMERLCKTHGIHDEWRHLNRGKGWLCCKCNRERRKERRISLNSKTLRSTLGEPAVEMYLEEINDGKRSHPRKFLANHVFVDTLGLLALTLTQVDRRRIRLLNHTAGLPISNIGWNCSCCNKSHKHWSFFDVDHVIPAASGGPDHTDNFQVLCPNCHKCKTLNIQCDH